MRYIFWLKEQIEVKSLKVLSSKNYITTKWSGGTTTQLCIYPEGAKYSERIFDWRISTAWIEEEESHFTPLPGVKRWIMPLTGELRMKFSDKEVCLLPFEVYQFDGGDEVVSNGKLRDFNLMLNKGWSGGMEVIPAEKFMNLSCGLYYLSPEQGDICAELTDQEGDSFKAQAGQMIVVEEGEKVTAEMNFNQQYQLIRIFVEKSGITGME